MKGLYNSLGLHQEDENVKFLRELKKNSYIPQAKLQLINNADNNLHRHAIIAISGFLSEKSDSHKDWTYLKNYCQQFGIPLYCLTWESSSADIIKDKAWSNVKTHALDTTVKSLKTPATGGFAKALFSGLASVAINTVLQTSYDSSDLFKEVRNKAKLTGKILGFYLSNSQSLKNYSISLVGFSLGTQVIKSTLKQLNRLGNHNQINNVYIMGGAISIREKKLQKMKEVFNKVVQGKIKNVYTQRDSTLVMYQQLFDVIALGREARYINDLDNIAYEHKQGGEESYKVSNLPENAFFFKNYDISSFCTGHLHYRQILDKIFEFIDFDF
eukprot:403340596